MIESKELPIEFVSIRQIWIQNINRCCEAISNQAKTDISEEANFQEVGFRTVIHTVNAFYYSLVDYGEAIIRTEVDNYREKKYNPEVSNIWAKYKENKLSASKGWSEQAHLSEDLFNFIIKTLNKYSMLFERQPEGYSNVEMKAIE